MKRVSIFLIAVALIAGMMGCQPALDPSPPPGTPLTYALNISSTAGGSVTATVNEEDTVIGPGETVTIYDIPAGTKVDLLASPDEGYEFVEWVGNPIDGVTTPVVTITVQGHYEITANFELIPTYELTMAASPLDSGTTTDLTNEAPYAAGTNVSIKAEANEGYQFVNWIAPAGEFDNADEAETTSTMPGEAVTITANFEPIPTYELTMAADPELGGTAIDVTDESPYAEGTQVSIRAEANLGYRFVNWTSTAGGFDNANEAETIFTMPGEDVTITANFELIPTYELTMAADPELGGTAIDVTDESPYAEGTQVSIRAEANLGYRFVNWTSTAGGFDNADEAETTFTMPGEAVTITANFAVEPMVAAGGYHTVGLQSNGTVVAVGDDTHGQCDVGDWEDIIQVAAGEQHTVGLTNNGTVVAVGGNDYGQCGIGDWVDIVQVGTGYYHTVGLTSNGTVVAVGLNVYGQCAVGDWEDIIQVAAGEQHTVGLTNNGTVVAVGGNDYGQCDVGDWEDIVQVAGGAFHTVGLKSGGTVLAVGHARYGRCDVAEWENITQVTAGEYHTVGLKSNGTMVAVGRNKYGHCSVGEWTDIVQVAAGGYHTVALKGDGTVVAVGLDDNGQCAVSGWMLN